ncbi:MAG: hypothetical protein WCI51_03155 [Lentisphaerota bacterium]
MNLPLLSPGMCIIVVVCLCMMVAVAATLYLTGHKFKTQKGGKRLTIFALSVFGLVVVYILFYTIANFIGRAQVESRLAEMRTQGISLDKEAVLPGMPKPDSDNGVYSYKAAFQLMKGSAACKTLLDMLQEQLTCNITQWPEQSRNTAGRLLKNQDIEQILRLFHWGAEKPYAVCRRDFIDSTDSLSELRALRELFRLISIKSSSDGLNGKPDTAYSFILDGFKAIKQFESEPFLISQLVNIACADINLDAMNALISCYGISSRSAGQLLSELDRIDFKKGLSNGMRGEIILSGEIIRKLMEEHWQKDTDTWKLIPGPKFLNMIWPFFYQDYANCLAQMNRIIDLNSKPYWAVQNNVKELENDEKSFNYNFMTKNLTIGLVSARTKVARIESEIDAAKLTLALHIYKNQNGAFPDKLEQLAPGILKEIPVDPISGKPFEYQKTEGKFTLSSVWLKEKAERFRQNAELHKRSKIGK